jgi:hypothetical protein
MASNKGVRTETRAYVYGPEHRRELLEKWSRDWPSIERLWLRDNCHADQHGLPDATAVRMTCLDCGGENLRRDSWVVWNVGTQRWAVHSDPHIADTYLADRIYCDDCEMAGRMDKYGQIILKEKEVA